MITFNPEILKIPAFMTKFTDIDNLGFFGKFYFNQKTGMFLSLLISANLLFHINSTIITPDVPLSLFLILAIMGYYISYNYNEKLIYISGFFLGMAILSKITAMFTALSIYLEKSCCKKILICQLT